MNLFKPKKATEYKVAYEIPAKCVEELCRLSDAVGRAEKAGGSSAALYRLWKRVHKIEPRVTDRVGWKLVWRTATSIEVTMIYTQPIPECWGEGITPNTLAKNNCFNCEYFEECSAFSAHTPRKQC